MPCKSVTPSAGLDKPSPSTVRCKTLLSCGVGGAIGGQEAPPCCSSCCRWRSAANSRCRWRSAANLLHRAQPLGAHRHLLQPIFSGPVATGRPSGADMSGPLQAATAGCGKGKSGGLQPECYGLTSLKGLYVVKVLVLHPLPFLRVCSSTTASGDRENSMLRGLCLSFLALVVEHWGFMRCSLPILALSLALTLSLSLSGADLRLASSLLGLDAEISRGRCT